MSESSTPNSPLVVPHERPGAKAWRTSVEAGCSHNDIRENMAVAVNRQVFANMTWIPFKDDAQRTEFERVLRDADDVAKKVASIQLRLQYYHEIGAIGIGLNWLTDLFRPPWFTVYLVPNDDFLFLFSVGLQYFFDRPDIAIFVPDVSMRTARQPGRLVAMARELGQLINMIVRSSDDNETNIVHLEPGVTLESVVAALELELTFVDNGVEQTEALLEDVPEFPDRSAYIARGRAKVLTRKRGEFFQMSTMECKGYLGMNSWFHINFMDTTFENVLGVVVNPLELPVDDPESIDPRTQV